MRTLDRLDEKTFLGFTGNDGRGSGLAALQQPFFAVRVEVSLRRLLFGTVATVASLGQHWANAVFEKIRTFVGLDKSDSTHEQYGCERTTDKRGSDHDQATTSFIIVPPVSVSR